MDKKRNIELENWLIETTGEEMMANHLGPNWNRFHEECGFYPNISMTIADQVWEHKQKRIDELERRLKAVDALSQMRAAALTAFKHVDMNAEIKRKVLILKKAEQALKGGEV